MRTASELNNDEKKLSDDDSQDNSRFGRISPMLVGIAGGTASGKTAIAEHIRRALNLHSNLAVVNCSNFYHNNLLDNDEDDSEYNFDHPDAFDYPLMISTLQKLKNGQNTWVPTYDKINMKRKKKGLLVSSAHVIIFEGTFALFWSEVRKLLNLRLFVQVDEDYLLARRLERDVCTDGQAVECVIGRWLSTIRQSYEKFTKPSAKYADLIIPNGIKNIIACNAIISLVRLHLIAKGLLSFHNACIDINSGDDIDSRNSTWRSVHELSRRNISEVNYIMQLLRNPEQLQRDILVFYVDRLSQMMFAQVELVSSNTDLIYASVLGYGDVMEGGLRQHQRMPIVARLSISKDHLHSVQHFLSPRCRSHDLKSFHLGLEGSSQSCDDDLPFSATLPPQSHKGFTKSPLIDVSCLPITSKRNCVVVILLAVFTDKEIALAAIEALKNNEVETHQIIILSLFSEAQVCRDIVQSSKGDVQVVVGSLTLMSNLADLKVFERDLIVKYLGL